MLVKIEDKSNIEKQLFYTVDQNHVEAAINSFIKEIAPRVEARGFRKGMAPPTVIRTQFKDTVLSECSARMVHEEVTESIRVRNLKVVGSPILIEQHRASRGKKHVGEFCLDGSFQFTVLADLEPEIVANIPEELFISEAMPTVEDLVNADLNKIRASMSQLDFVEREAQEADQVSVEILNSSNGHVTVALSDPAEVFADNSIFLGKSAGDEFETALKDGRALRVRVSAVFARVLPALDDELAKSAMYSSLEDMKSEIASKKSGDHQTPLKAKLYGEILTQLLDSNSISIPDRWVDAEVEGMCKRIGLKSMAKEDAQLIQQLRSQAGRNLRSNLILDAFYRDHEKIHMSADEAYRLVEVEAQKVGRSTDDVLAHLKNSGQYELLMSFHERNRVIDHLISQAKVKQEKV